MIQIAIRKRVVGHDSDAGIIKHYRVDKMIDIAVQDEDCEGQEHFKSLYVAVYARVSTDTEEQLNSYQA